TVNGATLWVGTDELSFQPGELAKILLAIFFAGYLVSRQGSLAEIGSRVLGVKVPRAKDLGPILLFWFASLGVLIIQRDLGTSILYFGLFLVMVYTATGRGFYIGAGLVMMVTGTLVASRFFDYVERRFEVWLDPFSNANYSAIGGSYQLVQGIFGLANSHPDDFSKLLALGLGFVIGLQVFVVAGGVMGLLPLTGLTTPFLAAGGSSLLANWSIIALLLIISDSSLRSNR
ncbi:MAG: FtsW/RodA/SpoVE family cell cycle protein, partial [Aquiluna sp.]